MPDQHDRHFKQLMSQRSFFEPFIKTYLPPELLNRIDWQSMCFYKMSGKHREEKTQKEFESDVVYLARFGDQEGLIWLHCEHQSVPDKNMVLRVTNYQTAELLAYAKQNPGKKLPGIVTLIYHQGEKAWPYRLDLEDLFAEPELAMKYFAKPILIDLPAISDEELRRHQNIGPVEMIMKHIRRKDFEKRLRIVLAELRTVDDNSCSTVLQYLVEIVDFPKSELVNMMKQSSPKGEELIMTVAQQWIEEGVEKRSMEIARSMLEEGCNEAFIQKMTKLSANLIAKLKKEMGLS